MYTVPARRRDRPCRYRNLSRAEIEAICNGCGGKGGWFDPPEYNFHASCNHHDFNYWLGGNEAARKRADEEFYAAMLHDADSFDEGPKFLQPLRRMWRRGAAHRYYLAVRLFGGKFFYYTEDKLEGKLTGKTLEHARWSRLERYMAASGAKVATEFTAAELRDL